MDKVAERHPKGCFPGPVRACGLVFCAEASLEKCQDLAPEVGSRPVRKKRDGGRIGGPSSPGKHRMAEIGSDDNFLFE